MSNINNNDDLFKNVIKHYITNNINFKSDLDNIIKEYEENHENLYKYKDKDKKNYYSIYNEICGHMM